MATANLFSWRQGPGDFGGLQLHACWNADSSLTRKYHGSSVSRTAWIYEGVRELMHRSSSPRWRYIADQLIAQILWQQSPDGGFFHASAEAEPTYTSTLSCPIHQMLPVGTLLLHYEETGPDEPIRSEIEHVLEKHLKWFHNHWWKIGNAWKKPLPFPGWCGVTNQDLVAIANLGLYGKIVGDWGPFQEYGLPALDTYLSPRYFHEDTGFFERGDNPDFTERCIYMCIISKMLARINDLHPDKRISQTLERVAHAMGDAVYVDANGMHQLAVGLDDAKTRSHGKAVWSKEKIQISDYPEAIMTFHMLGHYDERLKSLGDGLEQTLAQYVFMDGTLPTTLDANRPMFAITTGSYSFSVFWDFLLWKNPDETLAEDLPALPAIRRRCQDLEYFTFRDGWSLEQNGHEVFHGTKRITHGIVPAGETLANDPFQVPDKFVFEEVVEIPDNP